ncbi:MAG TPA: SRPBCC family protein [Pyrinomonadaceae bacterium]|jgi:uncharacterized protein YndB with AHSA1/START domain|nr:SRPBCC family protein [Pyrinomonadaceae bacterium]
MAKTDQAPIAKAQMLIRKPVAEVFEALVNPELTSRFWFSKSSGRMSPGKKLRWDWEMYGVFANVDVKEFEQNRLILIEWNGPDNPSLVEWTFEPQAADRTLVVVKNWGFHGDADKIVAEAINSTSGFSFLLAALKAFLEHGLELNLVVDHDPSALVKDRASHRTA